MGPLWHPASATCIVPLERLSFQGWPVFPELWQVSGMGTSIVEVLPSGSGSKKLNGFAGNAYHIGVFGIFSMCCVACSRLD